jgi:large subunit ribosomal protein L10
MPFSRQQKEELLEYYREGIAKSPNAFLVSATGITVPEITKLRNEVRDSGGSYVVVKNRVAIRAIEGAALEGLKDQFVGPTAVAYGDDPVTLAKVLTEFSKSIASFEFKGGLLDGQAVSADKVSDIASLPSREELIAKLLYLLQSPITRLARTLAALPREFVVVLDQIRQKKETTSA